METDGVKHINPEDRKNSFIIYLNPSEIIRLERMYRRGWTVQESLKRQETDRQKFLDFTDFDIMINNPYF